MIGFKSHDDLSKLPESDPAYPVMKELVEQLLLFNYQTWNVCCI